MTSPELSVGNESASVNDHKLQYLVGWRLHLTTLGLCLVLFLVNLEVTIVSTSNLAIANDLQSFNKLGWILTGYLITYTSFIIPWAKSSDIFGRKTCIILSLIIFIIFSGGCGAAQTMNQLIICRVFQGIGAAGGTALVLLSIYGMVPPDKFPLYGALMSATISIASLAGPLVGGALSEHKTWRWVFLLNVPLGVVALIVLIMAIPTGFPHHNKIESSQTSGASRQNLLSKLTRLDSLGAALLLAAVLLLTTGLLEGGTQWAWNSAQSIAILTVSGVLWVVFFWWERLVTLKDEWKQEPMFPWRFLFNRPWMGVLLSSLLNGLPFYILIISIPQRLETVNGESPVATGVKLLPYTLVAAIGSIIANGVVGSGKIAPIYVMWFFSLLNVIGTGLMITIPSSETISKSMYGYQTLAGLGIGGTWGLAILYVGHVVEQRDAATGIGALVEFRMLGGALGLAIMTATMENYLKKHLGPLVTSEQLDALLRNTSIIRQFPPDLKHAVLGVFADGYNLQMKITTAFTALQLVTVGMIWRNPQISVMGKERAGTEAGG
ncbi:MFS general substrate transporter [Amniculicola lignicola CBS 123094]|uniref:MFS general substrate transporter n=1 Tax=Amniculicola lignicola CBS 123094 TaxID=1392246 RepID=A0A6A5W5Q2_9PLEO|nr:MFS general substrate transporter [Amniculicola lignicola CBS 123094]